MQATIEFFSKEYDSLLTTVAASEAVAKELRAETSTLKPVINQLQEELNDAEQYNPLNNLEICGVANENLYVVVRELAVKVGLPSPPLSEIVAVPHLPARHDHGGRVSTPSIIIRFASPSLNDKCMGHVASFDPSPVRILRLRLFCFVFLTVT